MDVVTKLAAAIVRGLFFFFFFCLCVAVYRSDPLHPQSGPLGRDQAVAPFRVQGGAPCGGVGVQVDEHRRLTGDHPVQAIEPGSRAGGLEG